LSTASTATLRPHADAVNAMIAVSGMSLRPRYLRLALLLPFAIACGGGAVPASSAANLELHGDGPSSTTSLAARPAPRLVAGHVATCLRGDGGKVTCWGPLPHTLSALLEHPENVPVEARPLLGAPPAAFVSLGAVATCVLDAAGAASCIDPATGQFAPFVPIPAPADGARPIRLLAEDAAAGSRACAVFQDGALACRLAEGPFVPVAGLPPVVGVTASPTHVCALSDDGRVRCFGNNEVGGLGDGTTTKSDAPVAVVGLDQVTQISGRGMHTCALRKDGHVLCWGFGDGGQLGDGVARSPEGFSNRPVAVRDLDDVTAISAGNAHTCALRTDGHVYCWGGRTAGPVPVKVFGLDQVVEIAAGGGHQCALRGDGSVWCWGTAWWIPVPAKTLRPSVPRPVRISGVGP
jgi:hypothetical protein